MKRIVMKFGGTSVASAESRKMAISHVRKELEQGNQVIAVVSAMGRKGAPYATDTLLGLIDRNADPGTRDLLFSCGEAISACVFASELSNSGIPARPFTAEGAGILSTDNFGNADVIDMDCRNVFAALSSGIVPVLTGGQARTNAGMTTTLGRGSSDTSAVVIGGYLKADIVDIYTDVPGIAKTDPRVLPHATFMDKVFCEDILYLATWGASVIHPKAVNAGIAFRIPVLRVRSTFDTGTGTSILPEKCGSGLVGIAQLKNMERHPCGEYCVDGENYAKVEGGSFAIITAVCHDSSEQQCSAVRSRIPDIIQNGDIFQVVAPMTEMEKLTRILYETFA